MSEDETEYWKLYRRALRGGGRKMTIMIMDDLSNSEPVDREAVKKWFEMARPGATEGEGQPQLEVALEIDGKVTILEPIKKFELEFEIKPSSQEDDDMGD